MAGTGISSRREKAMDTYRSHFVASCGGLVFGHDIGISSGFTSMSSFLKKFFPETYSKQLEAQALSNQYCMLSSVPFLTMFTSSLYLAALFAIMVASFTTRCYGRRTSILIGCIACCIGTFLSCFAQDIWMLIAGRILLGIGIGFSNQSAPLYLSESAPYNYRGALNMRFQFAITMGMCFATSINPLIISSFKGGQGWRLSFGLAIFPAIMFILGSICLTDDTPISLIERGKLKESKERLLKIRGVDNVEKEFNDLVAASENSKKTEGPWGNLFSRRYRPQLIFAVLIPFFQQFTGMNVFMYYSPLLLKTMGFGDDASQLCILIIVLVNMYATFFLMLSVNKVGRRTLFLRGGVQMFISLIAITFAIASSSGVNGNPGHLDLWHAIPVLFSVLVYIVGFALSWGPLGWLVPSEIFPLEIRSEAHSVSVFVNMICTLFIVQFFPQMFCTMRFGLFICFMFFVFVMTVFIDKFLPETNGIPLEDMAKIWEKHWYWKRFVTVETDDIDYIMVEKQC